MSVCIVSGAAGCTGTIGPRLEGLSFESGLDAGTEFDACSAAASPYDGASLALTDLQLRNTVTALFPFDVTLPPMPLRTRTKHGFSTSPVNNTLSYNHVSILSDAAEGIAIQALDHLDEILPCSLDDDADACVQTFIEEFGRRAFRRPLESDERDALHALYVELVADSVSPQIATTAVVAAMIQSPQFVYQLDIGQAQAATDTRALTSHEVASHLAYLITDAPPDAELIQLAEVDGLQDPVAIREQAERLLRGADGSAAIKRFIKEWIGVEGRDFSGRVTPELASAFIEEVDRDIDAWMFGDEDRPLSTLLTEDSSYVNLPLAEHYGLADGVSVSADDWQRVELPAHYRGGLLTKALVSTTYSNLAHPSVILRGVMVLKKLICFQLGTPPNNAVDMNPDLPPGSLPREKVEARGEISLCSSCHSTIDPIGLGMEELDELGRFRSSYEGGVAVDNLGALPLLGVDAFEGTAALATAIAESDDFVACAERNWTHYTFGTELPQPACADDHAMASTRGFRQMILDIVQTEAFRFRTRDSETGEP